MIMLQVRRISAAAVAGTLIFASGGCQSYQRKPLELAAHQTAFLSRTAEGAEIQALANRLSAPPQAAGMFNPADGLSSGEAEAIALVFNADLRLARQRAGIALAASDNAGLWEDPRIGIDLTRIIENTPNPWKAFTTLGLTVPISGRLDIEKQHAGLEHATELARVAELEWSIQIAVRRTWIEWSALEAQLSTTRAFIERINQIVELIDKMEQAGETTRIEARLFRIEQLAATAALAVVEASALDTRHRLRQLMGISPIAAITLDGSGLGLARTSDPAVGAVDARATLYTRSPLMLVAVAEYEAAEKALELEVRKQYPDLHIGPGYGREDGQNQVLLGLSIPLPTLNANRQGIAKARAQRTYAQANAEARLERLLGDLQAAEARLTAARQRKRMFESDIVPLVDAQYRDIQQVARLGELNTLILLESLTRQQGAKISLIDAARSEALAITALEELLGPQVIEQVPGSTAGSSGASSTHRTAGEQQ